MTRSQAKRQLTHDPSNVSWVERSDGTVSGGADEIGAERVDGHWAILGCLGQRTIGEVGHGGRD